jgi:hypothetical protein
METGDETNMQFDLSPVSGNNHISNSGFTSSADWTFGTNWSHNSGDQTAAAAAATSAQNLTQEILDPAGDDVIRQYTYWLVMFTVSEYTSGSLVCKLGGTTIITDVEAEGQYFAQVYFDSAPANSEISFCGGVGDPFTGEIDNVIVYQYSTLGWRIKECGDGGEVVVNESTGEGVTYLENSGLLTTSKVELVASPNGAALVTIDWDGYVELIPDCYCICIFDTTEYNRNLIMNGGFDDGSVWTIQNTGVAGWSIGSGVATHATGGAVGSDYLIQQFDYSLQSLQSYTLEFTVDSGSVQVYLIPLVGSDVLLGTFTAGTHTVTIDVPASVTYTGIEFEQSEVDACVLDDVSIFVEAETIVCEYESGCIHLREQHSCSVVLSWVDSVNSHGFNYEDFAQPFTYRLIARLRAGSYNTEQSQIRNSDGTKRLYYADSLKVELFQTTQLPEHVHDALRLAFFHNTVLIDGAAYVASDDSEYTAQTARRTSELTSATINVERKQQFTKRRDV